MTAGLRWMHGSRCWQPVAFTADASREFPTIKRLVARGAGRFEIRDGDVFVDGKLQQKTLDQLRPVAVLVHDDRYRPTYTQGLPDRWRGRRPDSQWRATSSGYECLSRTQQPKPTVDWLEYTQWTCWPNPYPPSGRTDPAEILDHYGYAQNVSRGGLNRVHDILLQCEIVVAGTGRVVIRSDDGSDRFELELAYPDRDCRLLHNGDVVWHSKRAMVRRHCAIEFAVCDHRVLAAIDQSPVLQFSYQRGQARAAEGRFRWLSGRPACVWQ